MFTSTIALVAAALLSYTAEADVMHMNDWEWDEEDWFLPKSDVYPHAFNHYDWKYWWAVICESDRGYGTFPAKMDEDGFVEYYIGFYGTF